MGRVRGEKEPNLGIIQADGNLKMELCLFKNGLSGTPIGRKAGFKIRLDSGGGRIEKSLDLFNPMCQVLNLSSKLMHKSC